MGPLENPPPIQDLDDPKTGSLSGRGRPLLRRLICVVMTFLGGVGHALPFLLPNFVTATIMDTPFLAAAFQVVVGVLVFLSGIFIGSAGQTYGWRSGQARDSVYNPVMEVNS